MNGAIVVDLFCGGGGASAGVRAATGREVDVAVNHSPVAIAVHERNHPGAVHYRESVWRAEPREVAAGRRVSLLWASPDCRHFSNAKGGVPVKKSIRSLANVVVKWAEQVSPDVVVVENVREFLKWGPLDKRTSKPVKAREGELFRRWVRGLERRGYRVEWRLLDASHYGAPTRRKRLFVVARRDGLPIRWPEPTHGEGREPLRTAAECVDWSLPCPSIFTRKKPLAAKSLRRVAFGIKRYVLDAARPFIVKVNHGKDDHRTESVDEPMTTVTATQRGHGLVVPTLVQSGWGERPTQAPRVLDLHQPLGTIVADGQKHGLVAAFVAKAYGDPDREGGGGVVLGSELGRPLDTVTARDHHGLVAASLCAYYGNDGTGGQDPSAPLRTVPTKDRFALVYARLSREQREGAERVLAFLREHLGPDATNVVLVDGVPHVIVDIGFRMLEPHELLRAQFGEYADGYDLSPAHTKKDRIWLIGNSVPPHLAHAVVSANFRRDDGERVAA